MLDHAVNLNLKSKAFLDILTLYEYTWIGDRPYGRVTERQGKPLKGKALTDEDALYEKALTDREGLDLDARAKARRFHIVDTAVHIIPTPHTSTDNPQPR